LNANRAPTIRYSLKACSALSFLGLSVWNKAVFMNDLVDRVGSLLQSTHLTSQQPVMSASSRAMLAKVRKLVPPMMEKLHKGFRPPMGGWCL
jgi:hypothetical protein